MTGTSKGFARRATRLKVDGMFGPQTARFIKFFQEEAIRRGANCADRSARRSRP